MTDSPTIPDFLVVGCQRCGTTWIDAALRGHPSVYLPAQKQTYFFDRNYDRGFDWYLGQFAGAGPEHRAVGEVATGYCLLAAIPKLAAHLPGAKLIMCVRHPIERAHSYFQSRRAEQGWGSLSQALEADPEILERGRYIEQVEALLGHYPRERLLLLFYEDLDRDERAFLARILSFLGLPENFESAEYGRRRNAAMFPRLRAALKSAGLGPAVKLLARGPVGGMVRAANKKRGTAHRIDPAQRAELIEYYRPFNDRLAAFAERDLSHWNQ
jgi:hypothetical protein